MPPELQAALIALGVALLAAISGALFWLKDVLPGWVSRAVEARLKKLESDLAANTAISTETRNATNGHLAKAKQEATKYRLLAERLNRIFFEIQKDPEIRARIDETMQALRAVEHDRDWAALQRRLLEDEVT